MENRLIVSCSPHMHKKESVSRIMWAVVISLIPALIAGTIIFGLDALWITLIAVLAAVLTELTIEVFTKKKITILDGSAVITGILLAFNLPSNVPLWLPIIGSIFSIAIGKQVFGGIGQNIFNPALVGRVFLMASWPKYMTTFVKPFNYDAITSATPLAALKEGKILEHIPYLD
ncbi:MAG: RnfABCDGE type electron transport complex subunit D, partial [Candidatus Omnitrophica bacterium]|nr:RnfABCDGE type electron transport complex subunit D [Candidatus Omnitrophota bacterium]